MELSGKVALVTGGSGGIGRSVALALAGAGADLAVGYRERAEAAREVVAGCAALGGRSLAVAGDVADPDQAEAMVAAALATFGRLDILVNAAGHALAKLVLDTSPAELRRLLAVHVEGSFSLSKAALSPMLRQGYGRIINITSIWGIQGAAGEVGYSTAKAAVIGMTKALAQEVGRAGITVNAIAPGVIATDMLADLGPEAMAELAERTPLGRNGTPQDVAPLAVLLASPAGGFITGQIFNISGGLVI